MKEVIMQRSNSFAHKCVKLSIELPKNLLGNHIEGQLIRCATSAAANYRATCLGQSRRAFISKLEVVVEEADECIFWVEFLRDERLAKDEKFSEVLQEAKELTSIFIASRMTALKKPEQQIKNI